MEYVAYILCENQRTDKSKSFLLAPHATACNTCVNFVLRKVPRNYGNMIMSRLERMNEEGIGLHVHTAIQFNGPRDIHVA